MVLVQVIIFNLDITRAKDTGLRSRNVLFIRFNTFVKGNGLYSSNVLFHTFVKDNGLYSSNVLFIGFNTFVKDNNLYSSNV